MFWPRKDVFLGPPFADLMSEAFLEFQDLIAPQAHFDPVLGLGKMYVECHVSLCCSTSDFVEPPQQLRLILQETWLLGWFGGTRTLRCSPFELLRPR